MRRVDTRSSTSSWNHSSSSPRTIGSSPQSNGLLGGGAGWYAAITLNIFREPARRRPARQRDASAGGRDAGELARRRLVVGCEHDPARRRDLVEAAVGERLALRVADDVRDVQPPLCGTLLGRVDERRREVEPGDLRVDGGHRRPQRRERPRTAMEALAPERRGRKRRPTERSTGSATACRSRKVEAAGIEPASATAPHRASTSLGCPLLSPDGRLTADLPPG